MATDDPSSPQGEGYQHKVIIDQVIEAHRCIVCNRLDVASKDTIRSWVYGRHQLGLQKKRRLSKRAQEEVRKKLKGASRLYKTQVAEDLILFPQLRPVFILKEVFGWEMGEVGEELLQTLGNPVEWFDICKWCRRLVDEGIELKRKLVKWRKRYGEVKEMLVKSLDGVPGREGSFLANCKTQVPEELVESSKARILVRRKIRQNIPVNIVVKGDFEVKMEVEEDEVNYDFVDHFDNTQEHKVDPINLVKIQLPDKSDLEFKMYDEVSSPPKNVRKSLRPRRPLRLSKKHYFEGDEEDELDSLEEHQEQDIRRVLRLKRMKLKLTKIKKQKKLALPKVKTKNDGSLGRPYNKVLEQTIREKGNELLDMSLFTYPPTTEAERAKIPDTVVPGLKLKEDYGETKGNTTDFPCPSKLCNKYFRNKYYAIAHIQRKHLGIEKPWKCNKCFHKMQTIRRLLLHLESHETGRVFSCSVCNKYRCRRKEQMDWHILNHQKNVQNPACETCEKTYLDFNSYVTHMTAEHGFSNQNKKKLICEQCSKTFKYTRTLEFHQVVIHDHPDEHGKFPICSDCDRKFISVVSLQDHVAKYHLNRKEFCCEQCGKSFALKHNLREHFANSHQVNQKPCPVCGSLVKNGTFLHNHITRNHPEVKDLSLEEMDAYCKKVNEELPHKCNLCGKGFGFRNLVFHHYRTEHKEVTDKFKCDVCGKGYSRACSVKRHYEVAHAKLAVKCQYCTKEFIGNDAVKAHQRSYCSAKRKMEEDEKAQNTVDGVTNQPLDYDV